MTADDFIKEFELLADAPNGVQKLREMVLQLAISGQLQTSKDTWESVLLQDVAERVHYGYTASAKHDIRDTRLLRITDIQNGRVDWDNLPGCEIDDSSVEKYALSDGDILIARTGGTIGKTYLVASISVQAVFASYLIRVIPNNRIFPRFLKVFLESPSYWRQLDERTAGTGQPNVNATALKSLQFPLPPLAEQKRIIAKVDELMRLCDELESLVKRKNSHAEKLMAAAVDTILTPKQNTQSPPYPTHKPNLQHAAEPKSEYEPAEK